MPNLSAQIAGRLQPKRLACKNDVYRVKHHPRKHNLPAPTLLVSTPSGGLNSSNVVLKFSLSISFVVRKSGEVRDGTKQ